MRILLMILLSFYLQGAMASQEGALPFSEFQIRSEGIGNSGPVVVNGIKKDGKYSSITVSAFNKAFEIPQSVLVQIPSDFQNGIQISYIEGYRVLGGKTVYLKFMVGFTSGISEALVIAVSESGSIQVLR